MSTALETIMRDLQGTVRDCMTENVQSVRPNASIVEIAQWMAQYEQPRAVVVDYRERVLGVLCLRDLLKHFLSGDGSRTDGTGLFEVQQLLDAGEPVTVSPALPLIKAAIVLATSQTECLPVVGPRRQLIGLLTVADVLRHITGAGRRTMETGFQFYAPHQDRRVRLPAFIRRATGDLVIPRASLENEDVSLNFAALGYEGHSGRILVKLFSTPGGKEGLIAVRRDKENLTIPAAGFVGRFDLIGKVSAFEIGCHDEGRYLLLKPKQSG